MKLSVILDKIQVANDSNIRKGFIEGQFGSIKQKFDILTKPWNSDPKYFNQHMRCAFDLHNLIRFKSLINLQNLSFSIFGDDDDRNPIDATEVYASAGNIRNPWNITEIHEDSCFSRLFAATKKRKRVSSENESANLSNFHSDHSDTEVALIPTRNQPRTPIHTVWSSGDEDPTTPIVPDRCPNKRKVKKRIVYTPSNQ